MQQLCYQLSSVIGSLGPSGVSGYKGIFLAYETQNVRLQQVNDSRFVGMSIYNAAARNQKLPSSSQSPWIRFSTRLTSLITS
ncbi:hypothetical protein RRG08_040680 [Elysia crispata]|uniref:Uncharacterized protein n=1 Tax=Elysia crispata TaxID=231223 RepID=A0AAE1EBE0_9GAST|nr:hypothetical protein RRG08_040680 [Elysia crispata]